MVGGSNTLLNASKRIWKGEIVDLFDINRIADNAFDECCGVRLVNTQYIISCRASALKNVKLQSDGGALMAGTIFAGTEKGMKCVKIPESTTYIAVGAFDGACMEKIEFESDDMDIVKEVLSLMPGTVRTLVLNFQPSYARLGRQLKEEAYRKFAQITHIEVPQTNNEYKSIDGIVYTISGKKLVLCPPGRTMPVYVADGTKRIGDNAFADVKATEITLPSTLSEIGSDAFAGCAAKSITLPAGIRMLCAGSLSEMKTIQLLSTRPNPNILRSFIWNCDPKAKDDGEYISHPYTIIEIPGHKYAIPTLMDINISYKYTDAWAVGQFDGEKADTVFKAGAYPYIRQETAFACLMINPENEEAKKYVKRFAPNIAKRHIQQGWNESLAALLRRDLISKKSLQNLFDEAVKAGNQEAKAYILAKLSEENIRDGQMEL